MKSLTAYFAVTLGFSLGMSLSHLAFADDNQNNTQKKNHWQIGFDALYVQANSIDSVVESVTYADTWSNKNFTDFSPDAGWGVRASIGYSFNEENDVNINWTHYNQNSVQNIFDDKVAIFGVYNRNLLVNSAEVNSIETSVNNHFDAINIEIGQKVQRGKQVDMRVYAGLQYAQMVQTVTQKTWNSDDVAIYDENTIESQFSGIGPRFGFDSSLYFGQHISLFGNVAGSLLMGKMTYNQSEIFTTDDGSSQFGYETISSGESDRTTLIEAEAKLGVRYTHKMDNNQGIFNVEVGYEIANYWEAVMLGTEYSNAEKTDFGYDGIFFGVKYIA